MDKILEIKNLKASVSETEEKILDGLNLTINWYLNNLFWCKKFYENQINKKI